MVVIKLEEILNKTIDREEVASSLTALIIQYNAAMEVHNEKGAFEVGKLDHNTTRLLMPGGLFCDGFDPEIRDAIIADVKQEMMKKEETIQQQMVRRKEAIEQQVRKEFEIMAKKKDNLRALIQEFQAITIMMAMRL